MKKLLFTCMLLAAITSCKRTEDPHPKEALKIDSVDPTPRPVLDQGMNAKDTKLMASAEGALNIILNSPPGGPVPPHFLPAKDIKFVSKTDTSATYTFVSSKTGQKVQIVMRKFGEGSDIKWNLGSIAPMKD